MRKVKTHKDLLSFEVLKYSGLVDQDIKQIERVILGLNHAGYTQVHQVPTNHQKRAWYYLYKFSSPEASGINLVKPTDAYLKRIEKDLGIDDTGYYFDFFRMCTNEVFMNILHKDDGHKRLTTATFTNGMSPMLLKTVLENLYDYVQLSKEKPSKNNKTYGKYKKRTFEST